MELEKVATRLQDQNITLTVSKAAKKTLSEQGYDETFGARPLKRLIQAKVVDPIAFEITSGKLQPGGKVTVDATSHLIRIAVH